ncbi:hypothetical protein ZWY2020_015586 [Hordeum vulgare]|nr:hypothetical protein ZWY2020_015586 [Hordeum vulgare]
MVILGELGTEILIPVCGVIGIVSKVKVTPGTASAAGGAKNGYNDYLIEEEEGLNDHNVVVKCAEIQTAISEDFRAKNWVFSIVGVDYKGSFQQLTPTRC